MKYFMRFFLILSLFSVYLFAQKVYINFDKLPKNSTLKVWSSSTSNNKIAELSAKDSELELIKCDNTINMCLIKKEFSDGAVISGWVQKENLKIGQSSKTLEENLDDLKSYYKNGKCKKVLEVGKVIAKQIPKEKAQNYISIYDKLAECSLNLDKSDDAYYIYTVKLYTIPVGFGLNIDKIIETSTKLSMIYKVNKSKWKNSKVEKQIRKNICQIIDEDRKKFKILTQNCDYSWKDSDRIEKKYNKCLMYKKRHPNKDCEQYRDIDLLKEKSRRCKSNYAKAIEKLKDMYRFDFSCRQLLDNK